MYSVNKIQYAFNKRCLGIEAVGMSKIVCIKPTLMLKFKNYKF